MEDKTFELLEKMYSEFISFREEMSSFKEEVNDRFNKIEINQEEIGDKVAEAFEAISTLSETNNRQHDERIKGWY